MAELRAMQESFRVRIVFLDLMSRMLGKERTLNDARPNDIIGSWGHLLTARNFLSGIL